MTLLIATVTPKFGLLSADTLVGHYQEGGPVFGTSTSWDTASASAFRGSGGAGSARPVAVATKIVVLPHLQMLMAATGSAETFLRWANYLTFAGAVQNVRELDVVAPSLLRAQLEHAKHINIVHLGWVPSEGKVAGFVYSSADGFASVELTEGHSVSPAPETGGPDHDALAEAWSPAAQGNGTEALHVMIAQNQFSACRRGLYGADAVLGGQLHTAVIDGHGISVKTSHTFPGCQEQLSHMRARV